MKVELEWQLANGQKLLYVKRTELYNGGKKRASTELSDATPKATFGQFLFFGQQYFAYLWFLGLTVQFLYCPTLFLS